MNKASIKVENIKTSLIYPQKNIPNRNRKKTEMSLTYLDLLASIGNTPGGLINPITVRIDSNGKYELFAGFRRFLVYYNMSKSGEAGYETIPASIWPSETTNAKMLSMTISENKVRTDPGNMESLESKIAMVPFFLGCGIPNDSGKNKKMGYEILRLYNSFRRGDGKKVEYIELINKLSGCESPYEGLNNFFDHIGERERTFYDKVRVLISASPEMLWLLRINRISLRHARSLGAMKSDVDRLNLIKRARTENIPNKEFGGLIRESNTRNNPLKRRDNLAGYAKNISLILKNQKKDLTEAEYEKISAHLHRILNTTNMTQCSNLSLHYIRLLIYVLYIYFKK